MLTVLQTFKWREMSARSVLTGYLITVCPPPTEASTLFSRPFLINNGGNVIAEPMTRRAGVANYILTQFKLTASYVIPGFAL